MSRHLVAVYGSLRQGLGNHRVIQDDETVYVGEFKTEPVYSLYSLGGFPGLKENGETSVVVEVYEVNDEIASDVDSLEGYSPNRPATFYDKKPIETPWGTASIYTYVNDISIDRLVEHGDWKQFVEERNSQYV